MRFPLDWLLLDKWYWITVLGCFAVIVGPMIVVYFIVFLPGPLKAITTFAIIAGWGIAGGYKDWSKARRKDERMRSAEG